MQVCAGEPGFLRGVEFQREMDRLCYRERRTFCLQATVTMVTYSLRGEVSVTIFDEIKLSTKWQPQLVPSFLLIFQNKSSH